MYTHPPCSLAIPFTVTKSALMCARLSSRGCSVWFYCFAFVYRCFSPPVGRVTGREHSSGTGFECWRRRTQLLDLAPCSTRSTSTLTLRYRYVHAGLRLFLQLNAWDKKYGNREGGSVVVVRVRASLCSLTPILFSAPAIRYSGTINTYILRRCKYTQMRRPQRFVVEIVGAEISGEPVKVVVLLDVARIFTYVLDLPEHCRRRTLHFAVNFAVSRGETSRCCGAAICFGGGGGGERVVRYLCLPFFQTINTPEERARGKDTTGIHTCFRPPLLFFSFAVPPTKNVGTRKGSQDAGHPRGADGPALRLGPAGGRVHLRRGLGAQGENRRNMCMRPITDICSTSHVA